MSNNETKENQAYKGEDSKIVNASGNQSVDSHNIIGNNNKIEDYSVTNINDNRKIYTNVYEGNSFSALLESSAKTFYFNLDNRKVKKIYDYRSNNIGLVGRDKEIKKLYDFINEDFEFITSITAQGGTGKSKLAYEFVKQSREDSRISENWDMFFVDSRNFFNKFKNITDFDPISKNYVLVFDYVLAYADEIRNFLHILVSEMSLIGKKIKVILIERTSSKSDEDYGFNSEYNWYQKIIKNRQEGEESLEDYFYEDIVLSKLEEEDYIEIVKKYVEKNYQEEVEKYNSDTIKEKILKPFTEVDPEFNRVLYLLLTVDMVVGLNKEIKGKTQLLKYISEREERRINTILGELKPKIYQSIKRILSYATATDKFDLVELSGNQEHFLYKDWEKIYNACCGDWNVIINIFGQIYNEDVGDANLPTIKPDLLGELFCLDLLECEKKDINNRINKIDFIKKFIDTAWNESTKGVYEFLTRVIQDYSAERNIDYLMIKPNDCNIEFFFLVLSAYLPTIKDNNIIVKYLDKFEEVFNECEKEDKTVVYYSLTLTGLLNQYKKEEYRRKIVEKLEKLYNEHKGRKIIAFPYLDGLISLSYVQKEKVALKNTVEKIGKLYEEYRESINFFLNYSMVLMNLTIIQDEEKEIRETVKQLEEVYKEHSESEEVAYYYARGLFCLIFKEDKKENKQETIKKLEELNSSFKENEEIADVYVTGMYNLIIIQDEEEIKETLEKIEEVYEEHSECKEIAYNYAKGLSYLLSRKDKKENKIEAIIKLEKLYARYKKDELIAVLYAYGLFNLMNEENEEEKKKEELEKLEELNTNHKESEQVAFAYSKGLINLLCEQKTKENVKDIVEKLEKLSEFYKNNREIALQYAKGLYVFSYFQETVEAKIEIVYRLKMLFNEHDGDVDILMWCMKVISVHNIKISDETEEEKEEVEEVEETKEEIKEKVEEIKEETKVEETDKEKEDKVEGQKEETKEEHKKQK